MADTITDPEIINLFKDTMYQEKKSKISSDNLYDDIKNSDHLILSIYNHTPGISSGIAGISSPSYFPIFGPARALLGENDVYVDSYGGKDLSLEKVCAHFGVKKISCYQSYTGWHEVHEELSTISSLPPGVQYEEVSIFEMKKRAKINPDVFYIGL